MKSSLIINSTDINGNKKQKAITNINPSATSAQLKEFAQRFTALSTNSYDSANVVDTFNVDAEQRISGGGVSTIEVTVPVEVTIPVEVTVPGETVTIAGDTVTVTVEGEPVTVTVQGEPTTVTVEAEPTTVTVEAEPVTVTVEAEPATVTVQADPKTNPTFSLGEWAGSNNTYSAVVSYNGDGVLSANTGTLSGSTITVSDDDGNFNGVISAAEGTNFAPANLAFTHSKETVGGGSGKRVPTFALHSKADFSDNPMPYGDTFGTNGWNLNLTFYINYDGDGQLDVIYTNGEFEPTISLNGNILTVQHEAWDYDYVTVVAYASETENCMGVHTMFEYDTGD